MTKYLETKKNSIEEAIKSVVLGEAMSGEDVAKRMMKIKTMKSFANKVAKMKTVSRDDLEKILPDYISGGDITKVIKESLDPVNKVAVKKKFDNRKDKDIDNDGDVDSTDKYLHKRRKAISKAIKSERVTDVGVDQAKRDLKHAKIQKKISDVKKEETNLDEAGSQGMFIVLEKGSKNKVIGQFKDKRKAIDMMKKNAGSKVIQIGKFATVDDKPVDVKVGDELSYTRVKLSKKIKEETELDEDAKMEKQSDDNLKDMLKKMRSQNQKMPSIQYMIKRIEKEMKKRGLKEEFELDEGYESEVIKVLNKADIDGYFKMGKLYVNKRDGKDAKKALEDSDEITKLPNMVMEDNKMMKLTKKQRQALSSLAAKGKGSVTLPGAEFLSKKKQPMKVGRQSQVVKYEAYEIGNDYAKHTLQVTPGQDEKDVDEMIGVMQKKSTSMRETLAKMWGMSEGKNPFEKNEKNPLTKEDKHGKTMTGQKPTKVEVEPKMEKK